MITRRILLGTPTALLAQLANAQKPGGTAKPVFTHDLPDLTLKGWSATAVEVSYGPGEGSSVTSKSAADIRKHPPEIDDAQPQKNL